MRLLSFIKKQHPHFIFFLLVIIFLPQQFGPHFWLGFSFIQGIRVDYLSPSLYLSDFFILCLFLTSYKTVFQNTKVQIFLSNKFFLMFCLLLGIQLFTSVEPFAVLFGILKFLEYIFLGFYIVTHVSSLNIKFIFWIFSVNGALEAILAVSEFIKQSSVNGFMYFAGERFFTASSLGEAVMNTRTGLLLRPYATFPHPNVLAFYLLLSSVFATYLSHHATQKTQRYLLIVLFVLCQVGLFLTFSRVVIITNILFLIYAFMYLPVTTHSTTIKKILFLLSICLSGVVLFLFIFQQRFFSVSGIVKDILPRLDLAEISIRIIRENIFIGVGLNNFYVHEASFQKSFTSVYLQPVHNIFLLLGSEVGIIGLAVFVYFFVHTLSKTSTHLKKSMTGFSLNFVLLCMLICAFVIGLFDHFLLTTQQGRLMLVLLMSLPYMEIFSPAQKHKN